jgi:N-acetyl-1-D-myo-inositol-2-amino-2-deoxy-alpha-D-glucopyranoside deacetylase
MPEVSERVLFVHAHPDDETISTGGTIALLVKRGAQVTVVTCTRGEQGEVIPAALANLE